MTSPKALTEIVLKSYVYAPRADFFYGPRRVIMNEEATVQFDYITDGAIVTCKDAQGNIVRNPVWLLKREAQYAEQRFCEEQHLPLLERNKGVSHVFASKAALKKAFQKS